MKLQHFEDAIAIYNTLLDASSIEEAGHALKAEIERDGFAAYAYHAIDGRRVNGIPVNFSSLKPAFYSDYVLGKFWHRDPAVFMASETFLPYFWRDSYAAAEQGRLPIREWREVDDLARSHGYRDGIVLPVRTRMSRFSITLFSAEHLQAEHVERNSVALCMVGLAFDDWLRQEALPRRCPVFDRSKLTPREFDVLGWLSEGKTSDEIGTILGVSSKTIDFHVANIIKKLEATNRVQAVARAVRFGLI